MAPFVVEFARRRLELVLGLQRWTELDDSLERFKVALRQNGQNVTEVHMLAGQTHQSRGNLARALSEFRMAAMLDGRNADAWAALGRVSEERGDLKGAAEAYQRGALIRPDDPGFTQALARIEKERSAARLRQLLP
jgi:tetratricopeptide (TPR) repeat protein